MNLKGHFLVATDFSEYSRIALKFALALAEGTRSHITVLHVIEAHDQTKAGEESVPARVVQHARSEMRRFIHPYAGTPITEVILLGSPAEKIVQYAAEHHVGLIILATHGRTGLAHMLIGSVAEKVVRHSSVPVLTVKPPAVAQQSVLEQDIVHDLHFQVGTREVEF